MQAQLCKELNEEKFKNVVLTRLASSWGSALSSVQQWNVHVYTCSYTISAIFHSLSPCPCVCRKLMEAHKQGSGLGKKLVVGGLKVNRSMSIA